MYIVVYKVYRGGYEEYKSCIYRGYYTVARRYDFMFELDIVLATRT